MLQVYSVNKLQPCDTGAETALCVGRGMATQQEEISHAENFTTQVSRPPPRSAMIGKYEELTTQTNIPKLSSSEVARLRKHMSAP